jgi:hypothetical protein
MNLCSSTESFPFPIKESQPHSFPQPMPSGEYLQDPRETDIVDSSFLQCLTLSILESTVVRGGFSSDDGES